MFDHQLTPAMSHLEVKAEEKIQQLLMQRETHRGGQVAFSDRGMSVTAISLMLIRLWHLIELFIHVFIRLKKLKELLECSRLAANISLILNNCTCLYK